MKRTIIFFTGVYDTLDLFTGELKRAFEEMGCAAFVYEADREAQSKQGLLALLAEGRTMQAGCDLSGRFACVTFNNLGYNLEFVPPAPDSGNETKNVERCGGENCNEAAEPGSGDVAWGEEPYPGRDFDGGVGNASEWDKETVNLWEYYQIPYINILMDHPFHYDKPLRNAPATSIVLCTDRNHVRYIRRFLRNIRQVDFLPHAGVELGHRHKPLEQRGIDVLYAGALPVYTVGRMIPDLEAIPEADGQEMMGEVLKELVSHPHRTTEEVIEEYLLSVRDDLPPERIKQLVITMRFLDSYATSFFREQAVRLLVENGIAVTAYGVGWDQCAWSDNPYLRYGGKVLAPEILPLMNDSKIVLNTLTWFKAGAHDRVFNGMLSGAVVVTDDSTYLRQQFTDGKELAMFSLSDMAGLPERIFEIFGHLSRAQQIADTGYECARKYHTWKQRAEYISESFF